MHISTLVPSMIIDGLCVASHMQAPMQLSGPTPIMAPVMAPIMAPVQEQIPQSPLTPQDQHPPQPSPVQPVSSQSH